MSDPRAIELTEAQIIEELQSALDKADGDSSRAFTTAEYANLSGLSRTVVRAKLVKLKEAGRLETTLVTRRNLSDRLQQICAYRITPKADEE
ncbi:MAG: hypothetical protein CL484_09960 [Acidobacteria bacterium]|nr:hypothetical protein [Acidobacteriota bacterium]